MKRPWVDDGHPIDPGLIGDRISSSADYTPGTDTYEVNQLGPRQLWDEIEAAYTR